MQKFIVTDDGLFKYGDVRMHKDLLAPGEDCIGGGMYEFDYVRDVMHLSGASYDFGRVKWTLIEQMRLPSALRGWRIEYEDLDIKHFIDIDYYD